MNPGDIGPHPDAPDHYIRMGKPAAWDDQDCGSLAVRFVGATGDILHEPAARIVRNDLPSGDTVYPAYMSEWYPDEHELAMLAQGQPIRLLISGNGLPPVALWVRGDGEI